MFDHKYLTDEQMRGFEHYKYSSIDTSPISLYVMHPFWNFIVQFYPKWVAPNLLTFTGFMFTVLNLLLFSYYDYYFYAASEDYPQVLNVPNWVFYVAAFNIFLAYTLDGTDGKQARRTNSSNPLGELFDHGLDAYAAMMVPVSLFSVFGRNGTYSITPFRMYLVCWNVFLCFFLSHWEKYNTGVLFLPWGYDFSMWGSTLLFFFGGFGGMNAYKFHLFGIPGGTVFEILLHVSCAVANLPFLFYNVYMSYARKTGKMYPFSEAVRPLWPVLYFLFLITQWILLSPSNILDRDPRAVFIFMGTVFANICCHLIISQMSNTKAEIGNMLLWPSTIGVVLSIFFMKNYPTLELFTLYFLLISSTIAHIHYGTCVVKQMCEHFKIECFKIKSPKQQQE